MAMYDNKHWLLSHIQNSFVSSDNTGICEMVMLGEELPKKLASLSKLDCYPGLEDEEEETDDSDLLAQSFELQSEMAFGAHRLRSNTPHRVEPTDKERKKTSRVRHVKWDYTPDISEEDKDDMFKRKELPRRGDGPASLLNKDPSKIRKSLLSEQIEKSPEIPPSPYVEYAKFDGCAQVGMAVRQYRIFITMAPPGEREYPLEVSILATAKVQELVGLVCWKYMSENKVAKPLLPKVERYGLYIAEDDGEVDWDFPCLDRGEGVAKFGFRHLALVERSEAEVEKEVAEERERERLRKKNEEENKRQQNSSSLGPLPRGDLPNLPQSRDESRIKADEDEDQQRMRGHMTALEAPLYQSFRVVVLGRMRVKTEVHLGISGEKIEMDPVGQQRIGSKFWLLRRSRTSSSSSPSSSIPSTSSSSTSASICHVATAIAACDLTDKHSRHATFRLVLKIDGIPVPRFKRYDFEADHETAEQVVRKVNHIMELHSSCARKEYHALREKKAQKRRTSTFHLGPR